MNWDLLIELSSLSCGKKEAPETYYTRVTFRLYVEEADDDANKVSQKKRIGIIILQHHHGCATCAPLYQAVEKGSAASLRFVSRCSRTLKVRSAAQSLRALYLNLFEQPADTPD